MKKLNIAIVSSIFLFVSACVTINVYFPAAEAEEAAAKIIDKIIGEDNEVENSEVNNPQSFNFNPLNWFIASAHAQGNISISSPAIIEITNRMKSRYDAGLKEYLDKAVIGFSNQGLIEVIDAKSLGLKDRQKAKKLVADENRDRQALYRELAVANGHADWEDSLRNTFIKLWIEKAHSGWKYQDAQGVWQTK
ncbi:hypothetical protein MNBD_GAMMA01-1884 [hydrothermal vent metagenome]|uniref:DUF1318 domain-containing protein n=1 Tax=hydrothermal vent metagenome TaxID=652676 RepID=A0A3B0WCJ7_9ZZZZ